MCTDRSTGTYNYYLWCYVMYILLIIKYVRGGFRVLNKRFVDCDATGCTLRARWSKVILRNRWQKWCRRTHQLTREILSVGAHSICSPPTSLNCRSPALPCRPTNFTIVYRFSWTSATQICTASTYKNIFYF